MGNFPNFESFSLVMKRGRPAHASYVLDQLKFLKSVEK